MCNSLLVVNYNHILHFGFRQNYDHSHNQNYVRNYKAVIIKITAIVITIMVIIITPLLRT